MGHLFDTNPVDAPVDGAAPVVESVRLPIESASAESNLREGLTHYWGVPAFGALQHAAETLPDRQAIRYGEDTWTFRQLNDESKRCAAMLQSAGVRPGDRVGVLLPNVPEFVIAANGIWRAGAIVVALSPLMVAAEVDALLKKTDCKHVICLDLLSHMVDASEQEIDSIWLVSIRKHLPAYRQLGYVWMRHSRTGHWSRPEDDRCHRFWYSMESTTETWQPINIDPAQSAIRVDHDGVDIGVAQVCARTVFASHSDRL